MAQTTAQGKKAILSLIEEQTWTQEKEDEKTSEWNGVGHSKYEGVGCVEMWQTTLDFVVPPGFPPNIGINKA